MSIDGAAAVFLPELERAFTTLVQKWMSVAFTEDAGEHRNHFKTSGFLYNIRPLISHGQAEVNHV